MPSHFRLKAALPTNPWNLPTPSIGSNLSNSWRQAGGQAVDGGVAYAVWWWSQIFTTFPESTVFEWPEA